MGVRVSPLPRQRILPSLLLSLTLALSLRERGLYLPSPPWVKEAGGEGLSPRPVGEGSGVRVIPLSRRSLWTPVFLSLTLALSLRERGLYLPRGRGVGGEGVLPSLAHAPKRSCPYPSSPSLLPKGEGGRASRPIAEQLGVRHDQNLKQLNRQHGISIDSNFFNAIK